MKFPQKLSLLLVLFLCFAPSVLSQRSADRNLSSSGQHSALPLAFFFGSPALHDLGNSGPDRGGCKSDDRQKKCVAVPEGGSALGYLVLAGLTCACAIGLRSRRLA